jgi:hypothetical protein
MHLRKMGTHPRLSEERPRSLGPGMGRILLWCQNDDQNQQWEYALAKPRVHWSTMTVFPSGVIETSSSAHSDLINSSRRSLFLVTSRLTKQFEVFELLTFASSVRTVLDSAATGVRPR